MLKCPKCNIEYEDGKFCKKCGSRLETEVGVLSKRKFVSLSITIGIILGLLLCLTVGGLYWDYLKASKEKIIFSSNRDGNQEIYLMNADGTNQTRLTNNPTDDSSPSFFPDGSKIVFCSMTDENGEIYIMNADGTNQTKLTNSPADDLFFPSFSPDGSKIVFSSNRDGNYEIYIMNADGTNQIRLTNNPADDLLPSFSPDGRKITFCSVRDRNCEIYIMNADGMNQTRLTNNLADDWFPSFSPDGTKIVFYSNRNGNYGIYIMNADGTNQIRLTNNLTDDWNPSFSPDGSKIVFCSVRDRNREIYIMNADGMNQTRLTNSPADDSFPSFSPKISFTQYIKNLFKFSHIGQIKSLQSPRSNLLGKWQNQEYAEVIEFFSDNRASYLLKGQQPAAGSWTILDDGQVKLEVTLYGTTFVSTGKVEGDILRLERPNGQVAEYQKL